MLEFSIGVVGAELGNYRILQPIGKGGMASVYIGEHKVLGHRVAIKILHRKHLENESIERRFFQEARSIASIRHPSVVELYDFGRADDGLAYIVMELLEGETLRSRIRQGVMPEKDSATFTRQVAQGLAVAHRTGIIHRDLKPDNIFLIPDPEVELGERAKVLDFGIAKKTDFETPSNEHTATGILVGTPAYMSPEQCRGAGVVDARSDVYSLGVVLYRMVTNYLPFEAQGTGEIIGKHLYVDPRPPQEINPELSPALADIVLRCLAKDPEERFQSMDALATALASSQKRSLARGMSAAEANLDASDVTEFSPPPAEALAEASALQPRPPVVAPARPRRPLRETGATSEQTHPTTLGAATGERRTPSVDVTPVAMTETAQGTQRARAAYFGLGVAALAVLVIVAMLPSDRQPIDRPARPPTVTEPTETVEGGTPDEVGVVEGTSTGEDASDSSNPEGDIVRTTAKRAESDVPAGNVEAGPEAEVSGAGDERAAAGESAEAEAAAEIETETEPESTDEGAGDVGQARADDEELDGGGDRVGSDDSKNDESEKRDGRSSDKRSERKSRRERSSRQKSKGRSGGKSNETKKNFRKPKMVF